MADTIDTATLAGQAGEAPACFAFEGFAEGLFTTGGFTSGGFTFGSLTPPAPPVEYGDGFPFNLTRYNLQAQTGG